MFRTVVYEFGQKEEGGRVHLDELVKEGEKVEVYVHVGLCIRPRQPDMTLLWSRRGLEVMTENKGDLYPCMSLSGSANFTIRGDNVLDSVASPLASVFMPSAGAVLYLQLYNTTPCYRPDEYHAISGVLATAGCMHHKAS